LIGEKWKPENNINILNDEVMKNVILKMLSSDPNERPSLDTISQIAMQERIKVQQFEYQQFTQELKTFHHRESAHAKEKQRVENEIARLKNILELEEKKLQNELIQLRIKEEMLIAVQEVSPY
jgi:hypothetical protein